MPAGEQVALEPALARVLRQDLEHPAVWAQVDVHRLDLGLPCLAGHLDDRGEPVRFGLVGPDDPEVPGRQIAPHDVGQHLAEHLRRL